ncbi:DUF515 domain-containing protein [uncultured Methanobrevibacter sp.]|uniref:DUF515 domain-containing protein n=1 Tax=uncultured Methanobrevibacter sp. TaxID=253161 RepID=UPI0025D8A068|nr:DUF515 domain-containing protein [uncultured Methanobrevibacter sp.]
MKKEKDRLYPKGFGELNDLKNNEIPRPKLKPEKEITAIEALNNKLGSLFKNKTPDNISDEKKRKIGKIITTIIILTLIISAYYFIIYEPAQQELNKEKTVKINELHSLYKGPLADAANAFTLEDKINDAKNVYEVKSINVFKYATNDWKKFHITSIRANTDQFNRTMAVYENTSRNVIMPAGEAVEIVNNNDAEKLSEMTFKKPDTVSVPILVSRLQAGAGLISTGSIVDIYQSNNDTTFNKTPDLNKSEADVSGCTVLSIMRYEDNGEIESEYSKGNTIVEGNNTHPSENTKKFSSNVLEMLKGSLVQGYDEKTTLDMLRNYGVKLSNYEREINLGDLDAEYMLLVEVPQDKVPLIINNMDSIILTIPTAKAPDWMAGEINSTYSR